MSFDINWEKTKNILSERGFDKVVKNIRTKNSYVDDEISGKVKIEDLSYLNAEIENFNFTSYDFDFIKIKTDSYFGKCYGMKRTWKTENTILEFLITKENGFAILFSNTNTFIILVNSGSHPAIVTNTFSFFNSDGSTNEDMNNFPTLDFLSVKSLLKEKSREYLFDQNH